MRVLILIIILVTITTQIVGQSNNSNRNKKNSSFKTVFYGDPGKAALYSLILPGAGQIYNKRYWKAPIVLGAEGYTIYNLSKQYSDLRKWDSCWRSIIEQPEVEHPICTANDGTIINQVNTAFDNRQEARSGRETAWIMVGAAHLLNVVEAFVDRHLINFNTSEDLSRHNLPSSSIELNRTTIGQITVARITIPLIESKKQYVKR